MGEALLDAAASALVNKGAETVGNRAINAIVDFSKKKFGETQVSLGTSFTLYLKNARQRYNQVKTIATGTQPRLIITDKEKPTEQPLYVQIGVSYREQPLGTATVDPLLEINRHLLIEGTGGAGKSMLMRYLFLVTSYRNYVPILLELRRIGRQNAKHLSIQSILELVYACMTDFNVRLNKEQFEYSLFSGKYLFLFDGFDEIPESMAREAAGAIQDFCSKYPDNPCIITSRRREDTAPLETFATLETMPLTKPQARTLASRIWDEDEKTREFCTQLDAELFDRHKDFAENPLLLTMMFLTFMRNQSIPDHLSEFYQKAYDALYSAHDNQDKGVYKREFQCKTLDEKNFQKLFSYFCFQSYFNSKYEFSKELILADLSKGIEKLGLSDVSPEDYLSDLQNIVCMIVRDDSQYRFAHRSFQTYFAACYTCDLTDEQQRRFFSGLLAKDSFYDKRDYFTLLNQLAPERFAANILEDGLRTLQVEADASPDPDLYLLKKIFYDVTDGRAINPDRSKDIFFGVGCYHSFNLYLLFSRHITYKRYSGPLNWAHESPFFYFFDLLGDTVRFTTIDTTPELSDEERKQFYVLLAQHIGFEDFRADVRQWLAKQDAKRKKLEESKNLSSLLDAL